MAHESANLISIALDDFQTKTDEERSDKQAKRLSMYLDDYLEEVEVLLSKQFHPNNFKGLRPMIATYYNLFKMVVDLQAVIYQNEARREWVNDAGEPNKDYSDLITFSVEHEILEVWLSGKKGVGPKLSDNKHHLLSRRKQYFLAEEQGLGDKLFEWHMLLNSEAKEECEGALECAKKKVEYQKNKKISF